MPTTPLPNQPNQFYQAPLEANSYVPNSASVIPSQPVDLYGLMGVIPQKKSKLATRAKTPYELMMEGTDPFLMPDVAPIQTNLTTLEPLDDPAGLFHSQDGFGKYGYSSILGGGDNENRYAQNFRNDNPDLFFQSGFHPWDGIKKAFYWGGGFLEKTLESAVVKTGQGLGGLFGMTIGNLSNLTFGETYTGFDDWLSKSTDNVLSQFFTNWDENLKQRYHYFQEKSDRERKGFVQSLGDGDFWMNDISDGLGFLISSMFEAGLISKIGLGTKVASRVAPLADGVSTSALATEGAAMTTRAGVGRLQTALNAVGFEGSGHLLVKNAVDLTTQTLALVAIESAVEAQEVKDRVYDSFEGKVNPETGFYYTTEEKTRLSGAAAGQTFKQNMAILAGPKFLEVLVFNRVGQFAKAQMNKAFGQSAVESGRASGAVRSRLGTLASGTSYNKASALSNVWKVGSLAALGFVSEGLFEENVQLAISRTAEDTFGGGDEYYRPDTSEEGIDKMKEEDDLLFGAAGRKYLKQTRQFFQGIGDERFIDDELSKSIGIGGLFGLVGGAVHGAIGLRQQAKIDSYWNNRLNAATSNLFEGQSFYQTRTEERPDPQNPGRTKPIEIVVTDPRTGQPVLDENKLRAFLNKMNNIQGIMDIIYNTEDPNDENNNSPQNQELNKVARNVLFSQLAMEYIRAGKKDLLLQNLSSASQFADKDIQALGYQPGMMSERDKKDMLTRMVNITNRLAKVDEWIENNVLDNVSEPRQGKFGVTYTKTQKEKRRQEFEAKKAYLRGLAMQNVLLDSYLDDITQSEQGLGEPQAEILSGVLDENGVPVTDYQVPLDLVMRGWNSRLPALKNQMDILEKEFAYHWENVLSRERNSPKGQAFDEWSKSNNGKLLANSQAKAQEALERLNDLQSEYDQLVSERDTFLKGDNNFELTDQDGTFYVLPVSSRDQDQLNIEQIEANKIRRINEVKREEIAIQKGWIEQEWKLTAALKEPKIVAGRKDTLLSRRMTLSRNAYNTYFQREVMDRDNSLGQRKMKLYDRDESKRINAKKYKANEQKLLNSIRIQGKVQTILSEVNGQKLIAELSALLNRDLPSNEFTEELRRIIDAYNGRPMVLSPVDKNLVDDQITATEDEYNFVNAIFEFMPLDDRFNDKYYEIDNNGNYVIKPEYEGIAELAAVSKELSDRIDDLNKVKSFLNSIPESIPGDWNNPDIVKRRIADVYFETADNIINTYNQLSNNGQSEISGDSLSSKQDLDLIDQEIDELGQLKVIFEDRAKTEAILRSPEFQDFIPGIDRRIEDLKRIREKVKERLSSRLRENQDFLVDSVNNLVEQIGLNFDGSTRNPPLRDEVERVVTSDMLSKIVTSLTDLKELIEKEDKDADERKAINDAYWTINGQLSAIQEVIKRNGKQEINNEINRQKAEQIAAFQATALMQRMKGSSYYNDIINNINDSVLGTLQLIFYQNEFSQVGVAGNQGEQFLDDQPNSPVYRFREDYNLRKFLRSIERDDSRTPDNSEITKEDLIQFLTVAMDLQRLEDLQSNINTSLNLLDQVEREKEVVQAKIDRLDNKYDNLIVPSVQQLYFIRKIAAFLRTDKITGDNPGFRNWIFIQAPGGAGKTQTLGTWFNTISGIPRDRLLATAFTEEASRSIKKALLVGEEGPKDAIEMAAAIREYTRDKQFDFDALIIDEFPAIAVQTQKELFDAITEYTKAKRVANKGEFKVITMGDTNQLTFSEDGSITPRPSIIINPHYFNGNTRTVNNDNHPAKMTIIPSLTVNFRSNIFAITSFIDQFKGSNNDNVNANIKVTSSDPSLTTPDIKGVISLPKENFTSELLRYLRVNIASPRTRALIVNESKLDSYRQALTSAGITIITDPNDEVTRGIYLTTVKNVQGFSFDEVFIDLENNDRTLFSGTSSPNYIYNKAMYVAASRARNLIIVTNFPNFENIEDQGIADLENKALSELQTKDTDFISQRDLEINGAKELMGNEYNRTVTTTTSVQAENTVETPLDQEEDIEPEEEEELAEEEETEEVAEENNGKEPPADNIQDEEPEQVEDQPGEDESRGNEVIATDGLESNQEETDITDLSRGNKAMTQAISNMWDRIKDNTVSAYLKARDSVVELLFPTGQTTKYKISDGVFRVKPEEDFENQDLREGDRIIVIPFRQSENSNSPRKFGYAVITPALDQEGKEIRNSYRTVSILSDTEIDKFKEKPDTTQLYNDITENEKRNIGFVSVLYEDVKDPNGFITNSGKIINEIHEGVVVYSQPIKYYYGTTYRDMSKANMEAMIDFFIKNFYANHLNSFPVQSRQIEEDKIRNFYKNSQNAQIIIPVRKDVEGTNPRLKVPNELRDYVRAGRPYLMFRPYHRRSSMQFIALSRKFLDSRMHSETIAPVRNFVNLAKMVKQNLTQKGVTSSMGYSRSLSNMLSKVANNYVRDQTANEYKVTMFQTVNGQRTQKELTFTNTEATRIYTLYAMYSEPNTQMIKAETEKEIKALAQVRRARNYIFEDGETIYGTIESYDPATRSFEVKDIRSGEVKTKTGVINHTSKSTVGLTQQTLDDLINSNGDLARRFTSTRSKTGFVTDRDRSGLASYKGYKFMALLGSKSAPVVKTYNEDGTPKEYYADVIEILEDLFNFATKGELPAKQMQYLDESGQRQNVELKFRVPVPLNARNETGELEFDYTYSDQNTSRDKTVPNSRYFETNFDSLLPTRVFIEFGEIEEVQEEIPEVVSAPNETQLPTEEVPEEEFAISMFPYFNSQNINYNQGETLYINFGNNIDVRIDRGVITPIPVNNKYPTIISGKAIIDGYLSDNSKVSIQWKQLKKLLNNIQVRDNKGNILRTLWKKTLVEVQPEISDLTKEQIQTLPLNELEVRLTTQQRDQIDTYAKANGWRDYSHFWSDLSSAHPEEQGLFRDYIIECLI